MPLYDFHCIKCDRWEERYADSGDAELPCECGGMQRKKLTFGGIKRQDAPWIKDINGVVNDLEFAQRGKQEYIETRGQARKRISKLYADPYPEPKHKKEEAANKRVALLRQRYWERF